MSKYTMSDKENAVKNDSMSKNIISKSTTGVDYY